MNRARKTASDTISIHALTRRAAEFLHSFYACGMYFNPRSHEESGQLTLFGLHFSYNFNPRSHEESGSYI